MTTDMYADLAVFQTSNVDVSHLLIITDQKGSSSFTKHKAQLATKRHFELFIGKLPGATVIKNIGDSLMIDACLNTKDVPSFLQSLLDARQAVKNVEVEDELVEIRIIVMLLNENDFFDGEKIGYTHPDGCSTSIRGSSAPDNWLNGDLFGPHIALSFRASGLPSEAIVVVCDELAQRLGAVDRRKSHRVPVNGSMLHLSPALAFSPFKGLDFLYPFGRKHTVNNRAPWDGHLFLRTLSNNPQEIELTSKNPLLIDQQKTRVFTELVWLHEAGANSYLSWEQRLREKECNAGYIRAIRVISENSSFNFSLQDTFMPPNHNGLLMIGAYPNHESYEKIREAIEEIQSDFPKSGFTYPITTEVHVPKGSEESKHAFWTERDNPSEQFVVAFARLVESSRLTPASIVENYFKDSIQKSGAQLKVTRCGLIKGGLWDIYCIMALPKRFPKKFDARKILFEKLWNVLKNKTIDAVVFKYCDKLSN